MARSRRFDSAVFPRSVTLLFQTLILIGVVGCAVPLIAPLNPGGPIELAPNEALLIIHIDTDIALANLMLNNRSVAQSLAKGRHVWMARVPEGSYRWQRVDIGSQSHKRLKFDLKSDEELRFVVEAGKINYPGELAVRAGGTSRWGDPRLIVRNRNHSAMAVRDLRGSYDSILRSFPLHYAGLSGDGFLEYYMRERPAAESIGADNRQRRAEVQAEAP